MVPNIDHKDIRALQSAIEDAGKILITSHQRPDGDAVGSSLALMHFLRGMGKDCSVLVPDGFPDFLAWMPGVDAIQIYDQNIEAGDKMLADSDLIFCLDYNEPSRVGKMQKSLVNSSASKVLVDHHLDPSDFCTIVLSFTDACSTAEIIYYLIKSLGDVKSISKDIAETIYVGIMTDTGSFRYASMTADTHEVVAQLIRSGVVNHTIHENVYNNASEDRTRLIGFAQTERLKVLEKYSVAYIWLTQEDLKRFNYQPGDTEGVVNVALSIQGIKMAAMFSEGEDVIKISFRSVGDFSVQSFAMEHFKGGGHKNASGGRSMRNMTETLEKFENILEQYPQLHRK